MTRAHFFPLAAVIMCALLAGEITLYAFGLDQETRLERMEQE